MNAYDIAMPLREFPMTRFRFIALLSGLLLVLTAHAAPPSGAIPGPAPDLDPPQVVQAMLMALKKGNDQGIAELYKFSSPKNREQTGPLASFRDIIREGFPDLLGHRAARPGVPLIDGERAMMPVEVIGSDDQPHRYVFLLSKQSAPECKGCWMADAVFSPDQMEGEPDDAPEAAPEYGA